MPFSIQYLCWYFLLILDKFESLPFITCSKILIYQKIFTTVHLNAIFVYISLKGSIKLNLKPVPIVPTTWAPRIHWNRLQALIWVHLHWHHPSLNHDSNINLYSLWKILGTFLMKICQGMLFCCKKCFQIIQEKNISCTSKIKRHIIF